MTCSDRLIRDAEIYMEVLRALQTIRDHHRVKGDHYRAKRIEDFVKTYYGVELPKA